MRWILASCLLVFSALSSAESNIRIVPVSRTPESSTIVLKIAIPQEGQIVQTPVWVQFRIDGFALGSSSVSERADEIAVSKMGQTMHVVVDDHPYFAINEPAIDPYDESGYYYNMSYKFEIPYHLSSGMHTLRMFPARSFGESLKGDNVFAAIQFYVKEKKEDPGMNLSKPFITYNEPSSMMKLSTDQPILLDFYVSHAELSSDGYKVKLTIDKKFNQTLTSWQPYYIYGLARGSHTIRLQLLDSKNRQVPGIFNDVSQKIYVR